MDESNDTIQWQERHAFWSHYFDLGLITDVGGPGSRAAIVARRLVTRGTHSASDYGIISSGSVQPDHSVLILGFRTLLSASGCLRQSKYMMLVIGMLEVPQTL